jgi:hypothetical protein
VPQVSDRSQLVATYGSALSSGHVAPEDEEASQTADGGCRSTTRRTYAMPSPGSTRSSSRTMSPGARSHAAAERREEAPHRARWVHRGPAANGAATRDGRRGATPDRLRHPPHDRHRGLHRAAPSVGRTSSLRSSSGLVPPSRRRSLSSASWATGPGATVSRCGSARQRTEARCRTGRRSVPRRQPDDRGADRPETGQLELPQPLA